MLKRPNILTHQVHVSSKIYFLALFSVLSKTEKSRRITESRPVVKVLFFCKLRKLCGHFSKIYYFLRCQLAMRAGA